MMIPDPIELMEAREEQLVWEWDVTQRDVPKGHFRCPYCNNVFDYEPIQSGASPDSPVMCYDCLPADLKVSYDKFCQELAKQNKQGRV